MRHRDFGWLASRYGTEPVAGCPAGLAAESAAATPSGSIDGRDVVLWYVKNVQVRMAFSPYCGPLREAVAALALIGKIARGVAFSCPSPVLLFSAGVVQGLDLPPAAGSHNLSFGMSTLSCFLEYPPARNPTAKFFLDAL